MLRRHLSKLCLICLLICVFPVNASTYFSEDRALDVNHEIWLSSPVVDTVSEITLFYPINRIDDLSCILINLEFPDDLIDVSRAIDLPFADCMKHVLVNGSPIQDNKAFSVKFFFDGFYMSYQIENLTEDYLQVTLLDGFGLSFNKYGKYNISSELTLVSESRERLVSTDSLKVRIYEFLRER